MYLKNVPTLLFILKDVRGGFPTPEKSFSASPRLIHYLVLYLKIIVASISIAISLKSDLGLHQLILLTPGVREIFPELRIMIMFAHPTLNIEVKDKELAFINRVSFVLYAKSFVEH